MLSTNRGYVSRNNAKILLVHAKVGVGEPRGDCCGQSRSGAPGLADASSLAAVQERRRTASDIILASRLNGLDRRQAVKILICAVHPS
jgi:hypothetical protein